LFGFCDKADNESFPKINGIEFRPGTLYSEVTKTVLPLYKLEVLRYASLRCGSSLLGHNGKDGQLELTVLPIPQILISRLG